MNEERVQVEIRARDVSWILITSRDIVDDFINLWAEINSTSILSITGVMIYPDANAIEYHLRKEDITGVMVQEIKV